MARVIRGFAPEPPNMHLSCRIDYCTLLSPRVDTSRTGEAKLNLVRLRTFRLREIVFEQNAKSYNFERGFFFIHIPLSLTLLPWGGNDVQEFYTHVILSEAKYFNPEGFSKKTHPHLGESSKLKQLLFRAN